MNFFFYFMCFYFQRQFHIFNTVSFVFVHAGLLQILELRSKIALRFTWVWFRFWVLINFILYYNFCWILLNLMCFLVYFWLIVMFCLHALVVKRHVWVLYFPVWLVRSCGKILKLVPFNIVFFPGLWDSILNRVNKNMMVNNKILIWVSGK